MSIYWVPNTPQEQLDVIHNLKKLELQNDELQKLEMIQKHLNDYGFLDDDKTKQFQEVIDKYGWML